MSINPKNIALSPAASDLGLGDMLKVQLDNAVEEERKKRLGPTNLMGQALSPAALSIFGMGGLQ